MDIVVDFKKRDVPRIKKPKGYQAPEMGYIIHHLYTGGPEKLVARMNLISDYVLERLDYFYNHKEVPISSMEIEDIENQCYLLLDFTVGDTELQDKYNDALHFIQKECYTKKSGYTFIDDIPEKDYHVEGTIFELSRRRYVNRIEVRIIYNQMEENIRDMNEALKTGVVTFDKGVNPEAYIHAKKYISELIRKKIFRKEDLYGKVFKSETYFEDFNKIYKKYKKLQDKEIARRREAERLEEERLEKERLEEEQQKALEKERKQKEKEERAKKRAEKKVKKSQIS